MHVTRSFGVIFVLTILSLGAEGINHLNIEYFMIEYKEKLVGLTLMTRSNVKPFKWGLKAILDKHRLEPCCLSDRQRDKSLSSKFNFDSELILNSDLTFVDTRYISLGWMRVFPKRGDLYPGDADLAEYLSYLRDGYDQDQAGTEPHRAITDWIINLIFRLRYETEARTIWKQICGQQVCRNIK